MIYVIGPEGGPYKIGYTKNLASRLAALQTSHPHPLELVFSAEGGFNEESRAHHLLKIHRLRGEWFEVELAIAIDAVRSATEGYVPPIMPVQVPALAAVQEDALKAERLERALVLIDEAFKNWRPLLPYGSAYLDEVLSAEAQNRIACRRLTGFCEPDEEPVMRQFGKK